MHQQIAALSQSLREIEPRDASAGPPPVLAIPAYDDCWPVKLLEHPCRHDAHDANMPGRLPFNDHKIGLRLEFRLHRPNNLLENGALELLPLAVTGVELLGQRQRLLRILRQQ